MQVISFRILRLEFDKNKFSYVVKFCLSETVLVK